MRKRVCRFVLLALGLSVMGGCALNTPSPAQTVAPTHATPTATATPPQIAAQAVGANLTMFGKSGEKVAILRVESAGFDPSSSQKALVVTKAQATLFDRDHPGSAVSELRADSVTADRTKRTLTATGNATIRSLTEKGTPTIRADRMVWSFDDRDVKGDGDVLLTAQPNLRIPGKSFSADMQLRTFRLKGDGRPATGGNDLSPP